MKKTIVWALALVILLSATALAQTALPTPQQVKLNGEKVTIAAYNIEDENYFRLRDLADILKDTSARFNVLYSDVNQAVVIYAGEAYNGDNSAVAALDAGQKKAVISGHKLMLGAEEIGTKAYNVNDNNFYRLRDLAPVLNFEVSYDETTNAVMIKTSYTDQIPALVNEETDDKHTFTTKALVVDKAQMEEIDIEAVLKDAPKKHPLHDYKWALRAEKGELEINFDGKTQGVYQLHAMVTQNDMRNETVQIVKGKITPEAVGRTSVDTNKAYTVVIMGLDLLHAEAPMLTLIEYNVGK